MTSAASRSRAATRCCASRVRPSSKSLHRSFLEVGVDVVGDELVRIVAHSARLSTRSWTGAEAARASARLAKEVASGYSTADRQRYVAGSLGPGTKLPTLGQVSFKELRDAYEVLARWLLDGGADLLLIETCYDVLKVKAAMQACRRVGLRGARYRSRCRSPSSSPAGCCSAPRSAWRFRTLDAMKPDIIGMNCANRSRREGTKRCASCLVRRALRYRRCPTPACPRSSTGRCTTT